MTYEEYVELSGVYIREKNWDKAMVSLTHAQKQLSKKGSKSVPPQFLSLYGFCLAMGGRHTNKGIQYCERAVSIEPFRPQSFYYLGMAYLKGGNKQKAISTFYKGLRIDEGHPGIKEQLRKLGERRGPLLPFLPRQNILNKTIGKMTVGSKR
ncbi:MAG: tetratricopeptide repeat protein [Nitrospiria bacterium]